SCAAPSAKGDDKFITTDYLQQCLIDIVPFDTCGAQGVVLQVERLRAIGFGDAGISDQHVSQTLV
ncbi:hypothetical protein, partial [Salmonella enterica]